VCHDLHVPPLPRRRRPAATVVAVVALGLLAASCAGDDRADPAAELSPTALEGRQIAQRNGCMSCHSEDGRDGVGPTWAGLAGSTVELDDGTTVVADDEYLTTAIVEPNAQIVAGYRGIMPERRLDPDDVAKIVAYLREL
jgi:cytochrome c oxidase subunit 2